MDKLKVKRRKLAHSLTACLAMLGVLVGGLPLAAQQTCALLIASGAFDKGSSYENESLQAPPNDVALFGALLTWRFNVDRRNIACVGVPNGQVGRACKYFEQRCSYASIRKGFNWLRGHVSAGDSVIIYYSGHAAAVRNLANNRSGRLDRIAFLPADADRNLLWDIDLERLIASLSANRVTVVIDSCHSGGMRTIGSKGIDVGSEELSGMLVSKSAKLPNRISPPPELSNPARPGQQVIFLTACKRTQLTYEKRYDPAYYQNGRLPAMAFSRFTSAMYRFCATQQIDLTIENVRSGAEKVLLLWEQETNEDVTLPREQHQVPQAFGGDIFAQFVAPLPWTASKRRRFPFQHAELRAGYFAQLRAGMRFVEEGKSRGAGVRVHSVGWFSSPFRVDSGSPAEEGMVSESP